MRELSSIPSIEGWLSLGQEARGREAIQAVLAVLAALCGALFYAAEDLTGVVVADFWRASISSLAVVAPTGATISPQNNVQNQVSLLCSGSNIGDDPLSPSAAFGSNHQF